MIRQDFSYWLIVSGPETGHFDAAKIAALTEEIENSTDLVNDDVTTAGPLTELRFEVDPKVGVVEQWTDMEDEIKALSVAHPDLTFSIREIGEEDKSKQRALRVKNGEILHDTYARLVPADENWDAITVNAIVDAIRDDFHQNELAEFIAARFKNAPWSY